MPARPIRIEKERWYVYLLLKQFKGDTSKFSRVMDVSKKQIETWKEHHMDDMKEFIKKERKCDKNGGEVPLEEMEVPTADELLDDCLKKLKKSIDNEEDPAKLAKTVDTLTKLRNPAEKGKEKKSIAEAVLESIKK